MSKIIKNKKINTKPQNFEKKIISHIYTLFKRTFRIFQKSLVKSLTLVKKHDKKVNNFWTSWERWNKKQNAKNAKKTKNKIVNDGILLKFWISNVSIFFEKKKP